MNIMLDTYLDLYRQVKTQLTIVPFKMLIIIGTQ